MSLEERGRWGEVMLEGKGLFPGPPWGGGATNEGRETKVKEEDP